MEDKNIEIIASILLYGAFLIALFLKKVRIILI